jgi:hypothetical protein
VFDPVTSNVAGPARVTLKWDSCLASAPTDRWMCSVASAPLRDSERKEVIWDALGMVTSDVNTIASRIVLLVAISRDANCQESMIV